jgi:hypothetical protein
MRSGAIEELNAEVLFEGFDLETYRGLREVQLFGCFPEAALLRNCSKNNDTKVFQTRHLTHNLSQIVQHLFAT